MAKLRPLLCVVLILLALPLSARAESTDAAAAEVLFNEGRALMDRQEYEQACAKLAESQRLDPGAGTAINLAECYERLGKTATAWATWLEASAIAKRAGQPERVQLATDKASALEPRLSRLVIDVPAQVRVPGLKITRSGLAVGESSWNTPLPVDPGAYRIRAEAPGHQPVEVEAVVNEGAMQARVVVPVLPPLHEQAPLATPPPPPTPASSVEPPPPADTHADAAGDEYRLYGMVLAGVGVVGLGVGSVFALRAASKNDESKKGCDDNNLCDPAGLKKRDDAISAGNTATVLMGVGAAAVAAGAVLWFMAPDAGEPATAVAPVVDQHGGSLTLRGTF